MIIKESVGDRTLNVVNLSLLTVLFVIILYPLVYVASASVSDPMLVASGRMWLYPMGLTGEGYRRVLMDPEIMTGYRNTIVYTLLGTSLNLVFTLTAAYSLSKKNLDGRNFFMLYITFTMYFSGGLIPTYLMIRGFGWSNTLQVMVIPGLVSAYNLIIARTFFTSSIPHELEEAALIDGCSFTRTFISIVLPLSKPLISVIALYYGVSHWNAFFTAMIYLSERSRFPLQLILREILVKNIQKAEMMMIDAEEGLVNQMRVAELIRYAVIIVSSGPVIAIYPFLQKYFAKGIMIGAIKG